MNQIHAIHNLIILDESGSMHSIYKQALSGANETINTIRNAQKDDPSIVQYLSFVTFDSSADRPDVREIIPHLSIDQVKDLTMADYRPNGCTPLYDAMGISITRLEALVGPEDNVLVTVITDGYENSSHIYSASAVKTLVERLRKAGWMFTYIGANQDSVEVAGGLGIRDTMDFCQDEVGTEMMFAKMNSVRRRCYKSISKKNIDIIDDGLYRLFSERPDYRVTPEFISELRAGEMIVLGSDNFGVSGQHFLIKTDVSDLNLIRKQVKEFIEYAEYNPQTRFLVTRIGCGHAGWTDKQIAPLFAGAYSTENIALPESFWKVLDYKYRR